MKKYLLGLLAIVLAIGLNAFKSESKVTDYVYFNTSGNNQNTANSNYEYQPGASCSASSNYCSNTWAAASEPAVGANPTGNPTGNWQTGNYVAP